MLTNAAELTYKTSMMMNNTKNQQEFFEVLSPEGLTMQARQYSTQSLFNLGNQLQSEHFEALLSSFEKEIMEKLE